MKEELLGLYDLLDNINNSSVIKPEAKTNGVVEKIKDYLLTDPRGIQLVSLIYSGMDLTRALTDFNSFVLSIQNKILNNSEEKVALLQGLSPITNEELEENECDYFAEMPFTLCLCSVNNIEESNINKEDYNWSVYAGKKSKTFNYKENAYTITPKSMVGFSKDKIYGKTSCIILNDKNTFKVVSRDLSCLKKCCKNK